MNKSQPIQAKPSQDQNPNKAINLLADFYCSTIPTNALNKLTNPKPH